MTPTIGGTYSPGVSRDKIFQNVQNTDTTSIDVSRYRGSLNGTPSTDKRASIDFSLQNTLDLKFRKSKASCR